MALNRIVITGGTGFVGRSVCERLAAAMPHARLIVPSRAATAPRDLHPSVEFVQCNVHDATAMTRLLEGADALVHLVAILHGSNAAFERVHVQLPRALGEICGAAGVRRVVNVSALGIGEHAPSAYLRSKARGEAAWSAAAARHAFSLTHLRPSVIFGASDRFTNMFASLLRYLPVLPLAGANVDFQPVAVDDVAEAVARLVAADAASLSPIVECAGPEVLSLREIVQRIGVMSGRTWRLIVPLPEPLALAQAFAMSLLPMEPLITRDNILSMRVPNVASGNLPGIASLGIAAKPLSSMSEHFRA